MDFSLFKLDIDELIDEFTKCGSLNFVNMKRIWASRKFSYIFEASPKTHLAYFMQSLYSHAISYMFGSGSLSHKLGGFYCLYCLYETQPFKRPFQIYLCLRQVEQLKDLVVDAKEKGVNALSAIIKRMLEKNMFLFGFVDSNENSFTDRVNELSEEDNRFVQVAYKKLLGDTQTEHFLYMNMGMELDLEKIKKVSTDYADAKELAIKEASELVDVQNIKHLSEKGELIGDKMEMIVANWNVQKDLFYQQTGLQQMQTNVDDQNGEEFDKELEELLSYSP